MFMCSLGHKRKPHATIPIDIDVSVCYAKSLQSYPTLCNPTDCSPPGSSVHGILQARILEWVAISFSRGSSKNRDQTWISCIAFRIFTLWAMDFSWWSWKQVKNLQDGLVGEPGRADAAVHVWRPSVGSIPSSSGELSVFVLLGL